jgi:hypothetical protein
VTAQQKLAIKRLTQWSDPSASGSPTARMLKVWHSPIEMARDIHLLLELVDAKACPSA